MRPIRFAAPLILLATPILSQEVSLNGQVEDVQGVANQFFVDCSDVELTSAAFDLNLFIGEQVSITGMWNGSVLDPSVEVMAISSIPEAFGVGGNASLGGEIRFDVTANPGDATSIFAAFGSGFAPFGSLGTALLDPSSFFRVGVGTIPGGGNLEFAFDIPNDAGLVGLEIFGQAVVASPLTGVTITNNDCKTIGD